MAQDLRLYWIRHYHGLLFGSLDILACFNNPTKWTKLHDSGTLARAIQVPADVGSHRCSWSCNRFVSLGSPHRRRDAASASHPSQDWCHLDILDGFGVSTLLPWIDPFRC